MLWVSSFNRKLILQKFIFVHQEMFIFYKLKLFNYQISEEKNKKRYLSQLCIGYSLITLTPILKDNFRHYFIYAFLLPPPPLTYTGCYWEVQRSGSLLLILFSTFFIHILHATYLTNKTNFTNNFIFCGKIFNYSYVYYFFYFSSLLTPPTTYKTC